jgi:hypothetical protein
MQPQVVEEDNCDHQMGNRPLAQNTPTSTDENPRPSLFSWISTIVVPYF